LFNLYFTNRQLSIRISGTFSFSVVMTTGPHRSTLRLLLFNIFVNDICDYISNYTNLLFADGLKIYCNINNVHDCKLMQSEINSVKN
jgi:hypothetical protein